MEFSKETQEAARKQLEAWEQYKAEGHTDPNTIPDEVADAAQIEHYEFAFGSDAEPLTRRELGISRQAWKCAIAVAIDKMNERP